MCIAIPGEIVRRENDLAEVDFGGVRRTIALDLLPEAAVGEFILAHAGFAIQRLERDEAAELIELLRLADQPPDDDES